MRPMAPLAPFDFAFDGNGRIEWRTDFREVQEQLARALLLPRSLLFPRDPTPLEVAMASVHEAFTERGLFEYVPGHTVVGMLGTGAYAIGVRHYGVDAYTRERIDYLLHRRLPATIAHGVIDEPACVAHDDCEALEEMGRACWRYHHPRR